MAYLVVENFKGGLDTRRFLLTAPAGTLQALTNAHITRGGEIEKRKAFAKVADLPAGITFDLITTSTGLTVFGSVATPAMPGGFTYERLQHPQSLDMTDSVFSTIFNGRSFAGAKFSNGEVLPFYNASLVTDFTAGVTTSAMSSNDDTAEMLKLLIDADPDYSVTRTTNYIDITGPAGETFEVDTEVEDGGGTDDQTLSVSSVQTAVPAVAEVRATTSFTITAGTASAGVNMVTSVLADAGTQILGANVDWASSNSATASAVATQINLNVGTHNYTAAASGAVVTVSAPAGSGAAANGRTLAATTTGTVTASTPLNFAGGVTAVAGVAQISRVTVGGTFEVGDKFTVILTAEDGEEKFFGAGRVAAVQLSYAITLKSKVYATSGSNVYFCAVNDATAWNAEDVGSGVINMANQFGANEDLTSLGSYQGNLAVYARRTTQIWFVDPDPALNNLLQVLPNIGTFASLSVVNYAEADAFFVADSGIRSLRARDSSNTAAVNDIGTPIDTLIVALLNQLNDETKARACAVIEPSDGRYWLSIPDGDGGSIIYVFSYFPSSKIAAWSSYTVGFEIERFAEKDGRVYARAGDKVYIYGGLDNATYRSPDDVFIVTVELPYLDGGKPATTKTANGFDMAEQGNWTVEIGMDPLAPTARDLIGQFEESTFSKGRIAVQGQGTHIGMNLTNDDDDYARIGNVIFHYREATAD